MTRDSARMHARERNFIHQNSSLRDASAPAYGPAAHLMSRALRQSETLSEALAEERNTCKWLLYWREEGGEGSKTETSKSLVLSMLLVSFKPRKTRCALRKV